MHRSHIIPDSPCSKYRYRTPRIRYQHPPARGASGAPALYPEINAPAKNTSPNPVKMRNAEKVPFSPAATPKIAKADGDAPSKPTSPAMPGWKSELGQRLDSLIVRHVPNVRKAVKWNSPLYGIEGQGWFLSFHVFTHYVKVTFFRGTSLQPIPPGGTVRSKDARWIDIHQNGPLDQQRNWPPGSSRPPHCLAGIRANPPEHRTHPIPPKPAASPQPPPPKATLFSDSSIPHYPQ